MDDWPVEHVFFFRPTMVVFTPTKCSDCVQEIHRHQNRYSICYVSLRIGIHILYIIIVVIYVYMIILCSAAE